MLLFFARPFSGDVLAQILSGPISVIRAHFRAALLELIFVHPENKKLFCAKVFPVLANLLFENFWNTVRLQTFTYHFGDAPSV